jgi:hypothetical protein
MSTESTLDGSPGWATQLPPEATSGEQLFLYFQAHDRQGELASSVGSADSPTVVGIRSGDQGSAGAGSGSRRGRGADDDGGGEAEGGEASSWWLGLGLGSGLGYAGGKGPEIYHKTDFRAGYALAKMGQVTPEVGYFLSPKLSLSLQGRVQYIPQPASNPVAPASVAFLVRLLYFTNGETVRFYVGPMLGGGLGFRLLVSGLTKQGDTSGKTISDTVRGGPIVAGAGGGMSVGLSDSWSWILEINGMAGFPTFSMVMDFNTGVRVRF